jgi:hypothetical protein
VDRPPGRRDVGREYVQVGGEAGIGPALAQRRHRGKQPEQPSPRPAGHVENGHPPVQKEGPEVTGDRLEDPVRAEGHELDPSRRRHELPGEMRRSLCCLLAADDGLLGGLGVAGDGQQVARIQLRAQHLRQGWGHEDVVVLPDRFGDRFQWAHSAPWEATNEQE